jgi:alanyl-tRNA synthetase
MQWRASADIRQSFLSFFKEREHTLVSSAPLIAIDDPTLLFTNAGMNQFKDVFLGVGKRGYSRAADTQKCMRVSGKHNDLDDVGHDGQHHTFFEMLGNWSFGDYYKKEAISWAWELLTKVWDLPTDLLYATVLEDDVGDLGIDEEALHFWLTETDIDPSHVVRSGRKDNFWEMGDTGPCGPCSEIHIDRGLAACDKQHLTGHVCRVNGDCARFMELWNLVFIQYNRLDAHTIEPLPEKHVDTGMGFERIVAVLQGVATNYETDLFMPIMARTQALLGHTDEERAKNIVAYRVLADHGRAITFLIGDGVMPGNEGAEYTLRMILRRAARFGHKIGFDGPFLAEIAKVVIDVMGGHFGELIARRDFILTTITQEEERFLRTIDRGLARMEELVAAAQASGDRVISGQDAFVLWTQDGFPYDLTRDIAQELELSVDRPGFDQAMSRHRAVSGKGAIGEIDVHILRLYGDLLEELQAQGKLPAGGVLHLYETSAELTSSVLALFRVIDAGTPDRKDGYRERVQRAHQGDRVELVLSATPFYVESGGQVSDTGVIQDIGSMHGQTGSWSARIEQVRRPVPGLILHVGTVDRGTLVVGDQAEAIVSPGRRMDIARNHTATHLLHHALRDVLGEHVQQAGSLVAPDRLRFDFSHGEMLTEAQREQIEGLVNAAILADYPVEVIEEGFADAVAEGAMALFGEKYSDTVRVIKIGAHDHQFSKELCGGTHVTHTSQIGLFRILSEGSVAAGVRRIEAVTGTSALKIIRDRLNLLDEAASGLECRPEEIGEKVRALLDDRQALQRQVERLNRELARQQFASILARVQAVDGVSVLAAQVDAPNVETLREMCDWFREEMGSGVIVLGAVVSGKPAFVAAVTPDVVQRGGHAGRLVQQVARMVGGGGGGRPTMAHAGGRDPDRLLEAISMVPSLVQEFLVG